jgi:2Fe-2S ferredoxin
VRLFLDFGLNAVHFDTKLENSMAKITYIEHSGKEHIVDVDSGLSVMEGAVRNLIPGIDADCGGACACATCHVYIDAAWAEKTGSRETMEDSMLDFADGVQDNSRLSCQIKVSDELDGLVVRMPSVQG